MVAKLEFGKGKVVDGRKARIWKRHAGKATIWKRHDGQWWESWDL